MQKSELIERIFTQEIENKPIVSCEALENQGYCNDVFIVKTRKKSYILRAFKNSKINREREYIIHTLAYKNNLTSKIIEQDKRYMLTSFLEGKHKSTLETQEIIAFAKKVQKLHTIAFNQEPIHLEVKRYSQNYTKAMEILSLMPKEYVLCHNDLNPQNIIFSKTIKFIDWEYAGVNDKYFDLASVCIEFNFTKKEEKYFLESYFENKEISYEKLEAYKIIYRELCQEWFKKC